MKLKHIDKRNPLWAKVNIYKPTDNLYYHLIEMNDEVTLFQSDNDWSYRVTDELGTIKNTHGKLSDYKTEEEQLKAILKRQDLEVIYD